MRRAQIAAQDERLTPEQLLARARFRDCLDMLDGDHSPKALLIRLRAMLYLGEHHEVTRAAFLEFLPDMPMLERGRAMALVGTAYFRAGMPEAAEPAFAQAYRFVSNDASALAEVRFYEALLRWSLGELDAADALVHHLIGDRQWRAKALDLRSWIRAKRGDYVGQLADLKAAYRAISGEDVWEKAAILRSASALTRELYDEDTAAFLERSAQELAWSDDTWEQEFYTFRNLAWCAALGGRSVTAFDYLTRAQLCAPSEAHAVIIESDRATIASYSHEPATASRRLEAAIAAAQKADWPKVGEARTALLLMAELLAPHDPKAAKNFLDRYTRLALPLSPLLSFGNADERLHALEQYTAGIVLNALGEREDAIAALERAYAVWSSAGYCWRAALAAAHLGEITGMQEYVLTAKELVEKHVPNAFFAAALQRYRVREEDPDVLALSPTRREILRCFIAGMVNQEIANTLNLSRQTVKNNLRHIYRVFGAESDRHLWRILLDRGIAQRFVPAQRHEK